MYWWSKDNIALLQNQTLSLNYSQTLRKTRFTLSASYLNKFLGLSSLEAIFNWSEQLMATMPFHLEAMHTLYWRLHLTIPQLCDADSYWTSFYLVSPLRKLDPFLPRWSKISLARFPHWWSALKVVNLLLNAKIRWEPSTASTPDPTICSLKPSSQKRPALQEKYFWSTLVWTCDLGRTKGPWPKSGTRAVAHPTVLRCGLTCSYDELRLLVSWRTITWNSWHLDLRDSWVFLISGVPPYLVHSWHSIPDRNAPYFSSCLTGHVSYSYWKYGVFPSTQEVYLR